MDPVLINKADPSKAPKVHRLEELETMFVSLVDAGANRQKKFFVVKADEAGRGPGGVCVCPKCGYEIEHTNRREGKQCNEEKCPECGTTMTRKDDAQKAVPPQDASSEEKRKAQAARSSQYGIEALESGANLSYPSGDPTKESMYGDPVNLKYPMARAANTPDVGRIRNAIARFKQAADTYSKDSSKARVYERIVRAALAQGVSVTFDPEDAIDSLLPADLKTRLQEKSGDGDGDDDAPQDGGDAEGESKADLGSWLEDAGARADEMLVDMTLEQELAAASSGDAAKSRTEDNNAQVIGKRGTAPSEDRDEESKRKEQDLQKAREEKALLEKKLAAKERALRKERSRVKALKSTIGASTALPTGEEISESGEKRSTGWAGDLATEEETE